MKEIDKAINTQRIVSELFRHLYQIFMQMKNEKNLEDKL